MCIRDRNYTPYDGDGAFLAPATARTTALREKFDALLAEEREKGGVRNIDKMCIRDRIQQIPAFITCFLLITLPPRNNS